MYAHLAMPAEQHGYAVLQGVIKACLNTDAAQRATANTIAWVLCREAQQLGWA